MNEILISKDNIGSFYENLKEEYTVYGVKEKEEGFYVFDETDGFCDPLWRLSSNYPATQEISFPSARDPAAI